MRLWRVNYSNENELRFAHELTALPSLWKYYNNADEVGKS